MKKIIYAIAVFIVAVTSCKTPNVAYLSDMRHNQSEVVKNVLDIRVRPDDKLSILVKSQDQRLSELFNLTIYTQRIGTSSSTSNISTYTVDGQGNIEFPILGQLHVAGMMRDEVAQLIKNELIARKQINDPHVTVEYANLAVDVMGEVNKPGRYSFDRDHITLLDALSMAGDLTIFGKRDSVKVVRPNGIKDYTTYVVNLQRVDDL